MVYKNPDHTSQETHHVSATDASQLMQWRIEVFTATMKDAALCYIRTQIVPHRKHHVSATDSSQLMRCKIEVFTVTMKNAVLRYIRTQIVPHKKHITSPTEPSRLTLCKVWGFHGGDYEEFCLLGCGAMWILLEPTFRRNPSLPSPSWKE
jgi:hypothetical protein